MWSKEEVWDFGRTLIGMQEFDASCLANCTNISTDEEPVYIVTRVCHRDGHDEYIPLDEYIPHRINMRILNDIVVNTFLG